MYTCIEKLRRRENVITYALYMAIPYICSTWWDITTFTIYVNVRLVNVCVEWNCGRWKHILCTSLSPGRRRDSLNRVCELLTSNYQRKLRVTIRRSHKKTPFEIHVDVFTDQKWHPYIQINIIKDYAFATPGLALACHPQNGDLQGVWGGGMEHPPPKTGGPAPPVIFFVIKCFKTNFCYLHSWILGSNLNVWAKCRRTFKSDSPPWYM